MVATAESWKQEPFAEGVPIPYAASFTEAEFVHLREGRIPEDMDDKWFIYFDEPYLYLHRSWTGKPVYKVAIAQKNESRVVVEALISKEFEKDDAINDAALLDFPISNLLLGQRKPFPVPDDISGSAPGVYQHHVTGTGYPEAKLPLRPKPRSWWRFQG
jgi:hypothetical protein